MLATMDPRLPAWTIVASLATALVLPGCRSSGSVKPGAGTAPSPTSGEAGPEWRTVPDAGSGTSAAHAVASDLLRLSGPGRIWPGFDVVSFCTVLVDSKDEQAPPLAVGACEAPPSGAGQWVGSRPVRSTEMEVRSGRSVGLPVESVLLIPIAGGQAGSRTASEGTATAVHELFHRFQTARALDIPFELRERPDDVEPPEELAQAGSRAYLESTYPSMPGRLKLLKSETKELLTAYTLLLSGKKRSDPAFQRAVKAFRTARQARWALGKIHISDEESWERIEGTAVGASRRALRLLNYPDTTVVGDLAADGSLADEATVHSYLYVHGSLQTAILDAAVRGDGWTELIFPGRSGAGLPVFEVFTKMLIGKDGAP